LGARDPLRGAPIVARRSAPDPLGGTAEAMGDSDLDVRAVLKERVIPALRLRGFRGSFPHFRRLAGAKLELVTFQFDKWGSGNFVVNLASCPSSGAVMAWGEHIPPGRVTAYHLHPRLRLGARDAESDHWFEYSAFASDAAAASENLLRLLDTQGATWWRAA